MNQLTELLNAPIPEIGLFTTLVNFVLCMTMGFFLRLFYVHCSYSLTGKNHIGAVLPVLSAVVFLVITIVKSSLALSLGLVGALSIVRFRTPIKEPEELIYLFIAISLGLGYGAGQTVVTTVIAILTLLMAYLFLYARGRQSALEYNMVLEWSPGNKGVEDMIGIISPHTTSLKLVRVERGDQADTMVLMLTPKSHGALDEIYNELTRQNDKVSVSFYESQNA